MADMFAAVANQNSKIQSILISETESGSTNKVPKLLDLTDYENWKGRFETHLNGTDTNLWERILFAYERPKVVGTDLDQTIDRLDVEQRKKYDYEKKAYWMLSEVIPNQILHQFDEHKTSYVLKHNSSDVVNTSAVVKLATNTDASDVLMNKQSISKSSALVDNHKEKKKRVPCEICRLFNHSTDECWYRKGSKFNKIKHKNKNILKMKNEFSSKFVPESSVVSNSGKSLQGNNSSTSKKGKGIVPDSGKQHLTASHLIKDTKMIKHKNKKSSSDVSDEIKILTQNHNQLMLMMQQLIGKVNLAEASVDSFHKKKSKSEVKAKSSDKNDSSVASTGNGPSACQNSIWYVDSGGSMHMTGSRSLLHNYFTGRKGFVSFGNDAKGYIIGKGVVTNGEIRFDDVNHVENLKYNLLSVSQICDKGHVSLFTKQDCRILSSDVMPLIGKVLDEYTLLKANRVGKVYAFDLSKKISVKGHPCLFSKASFKESNLWHRRLGHVNIKNMNQLVKHGLVRGLPLKDFSCDENCTACLKGKQHKVSFPPIGDSKSTGCLQLLHMDLFGPVQIMSMAKKKYCLVIVDDYSKFVWTFFLHSKGEVAKAIINFVLYAEKQYSIPIKCVRSDNGTEFRNHILDEFYMSKGIQRQYSIPRTPEQNGVVERKNRTLIEAARTMLADSGLPLIFWAEAVNTACYVQNRVLVNQRWLKTPYEILHNLTPLISFFRAFGCPCYILNTKDQLTKFDSKVDAGYFVGYSSTCKAYRVFNCRTKIVEETLHVKFNECPKDSIPQNPAEMFDLNILQHEFPVEPNVEAHEVLTADPPKASTETTQGSPDDEDESTHLFRFSDNLPLYAKSDAPPAPVDPPNTNADEILASSKSFEIPAAVFPESSSTAASVPPANTCTDLIPYQELKDHPLSQVLGDISAGVSTRSQLSNFCLYALFVSQQEPKNYHIALRDIGWVEAMQLELLQFKKQQVWELVSLPPGKCAIGTKWVFRNKTDENGQIIKNKARLVVQGFSQEEGIDYDKTFAPVARLEAIRLFLAYAALHKLKVFQMDVKSAFLYGKIKEEVYVCQPPGFEDNKHPDWVYKLDKALYGLKQAPRAWYDTLSTFLLKNNFTRGSIDKTLFIKNVGQHNLLVQIYVDDIIFASSDLKLCDAFTELMTKKFEMSAMGELKFFLGLQIKQKHDGIFIHQSKYIKELLKKFDLQNCKPCSSPMSSTTQLDADLKGTSVDETLYRCMIGSLMYLTASRPDIMFATCVCARFQAAPKESHLIAVKRIFRYLQGTQSLGIWYSTGHSCKLVAFSDSDYAGCKLSRKSTSGGCQFLGNCLVSWQSKKQTSVATSTAEAEYIAAASCTSQILWLQSQLLDYGIKELKTPLLMDSALALCIVKNPVQHSRTKHIEIKHHFIRDCYEKDDDGDMTGVGSSRRLNSITSGISFDATPISSVSSDKVKDNEEAEIEDLTELEYPKQVVDGSLPTFMKLFKQANGRNEDRDLEEGEIESGYGKEDLVVLCGVKVNDIQNANDSGKMIIGESDQSFEVEQDDHVDENLYNLQTLKKIFDIEVHYRVPSRIVDSMKIKTHMDMWRESQEEHKCIIDHLMIFKQMVEVFDEKVQEGQSRQFSRFKIGSKYKMRGRIVSYGYFHNIPGILMNRGCYVVKRIDGCQYFGKAFDIMSLPSFECMQLSRLRMIKPIQTEHNERFEKLLKKKTKTGWNWLVPQFSVLKHNFYVELMKLQKEFDERDAKIEAERLSKIPKSERRRGPERFENCVF
ncbi:hypothetical protein E3N88_10094 [Mikania micrantha]|uniref:Integrase catalytic domain-containing protein n=1 Tax=Mikania micrantha TaxID=192012 RepID=A0A5N6P9V4_9ASTR|nr:hypothetical protein E3N88_10094 [Mikania micrantha]